MEKICPVCESSNITTQWQMDSLEYGAGANPVLIPTHVPVRTCDSCHFSYLDEEGMDIRHNAVMHYLKV